MSSSSSSEPFTITDHQQRQLDRMIAENNTTDQTDLIRQMKNSAKLRVQISTLQDILVQHQLDAGDGPVDKDALYMEALAECELLCMGYPEIYKLIIAGRADMTDINQMMEALEDIEEGRLTQHIGAFKAGKSLTERHTSRIINEQNADVPDESINADGYRGAVEGREDLTWTQWQELQASNKPKSRKDKKKEHRIRQKEAKKGKK